jgi:hypothetical protein
MSRVERSLGQGIRCLEMVSRSQKEAAHGQESVAERPRHHTLMAERLWSPREANATQDNQHSMAQGGR